MPKTNATHFRQVVDDFEYNHEQNENHDITKSQVRDKIVELKMRVNKWLTRLVLPIWVHCHTIYLIMGH